MKIPQNMPKITIPDLPRKSDHEVNKRSMTRVEIYQVSNDFKRECMTEFAITGSFALELHASKQNTPIHRTVDDVDFMVKDIALLAHNMKNSISFDINKSNFAYDENNGWIVHTATGFVVDVLKAGRQFGSFSSTSVEIINGFPVVSLDTLKNSVLKRNHRRGDIDFINSIDTVI